MTAEKKVRMDTDNEPDEAPSGGSSYEQNSKESDEPVNDSGASESTADAVKDLEKKLDAAAGEARENYDRLLRVSAEFENYKKRSAREMDELRKFAVQSLVKDLLPIIDNLELALKSSSERQNGSSLRDGVALTHKEIMKTLEKYNVRQIEALGNPFDPSFHEAVMREEDEDHPPNTVINELQKGYLLHDRLIRPSMVVVSMSKAGGDDEGDA